MNRDPREHAARRGATPSPSPLVLVPAALTASLALVVAWVSFSLPLGWNISLQRQIVTALCVISLAVLGAWLAIRTVQRPDSRAGTRLMGAATVALAALAVLVTLYPPGRGSAARRRPRPAEPVRVVSSTPEDGAASVGVDQPLIFHLDRRLSKIPSGDVPPESALDLVSVRTDLRRPEEYVFTSYGSPGSLTLSRNGRELRFDPTTPLRFAHRYEVYVGGGVRSPARDRSYRIQEQRLRFTTQPAFRGEAEQGPDPRPYRPERIHLAVEKNGAVEVTGLPGALRTPLASTSRMAGLSVTRGNKEVCRVVISVQQDGSFFGRLGREDGCRLGSSDDIVVLILDRRKRVTARFLPTFRVMADGTFRVPPGESATFETRDGVVVQVPADALPWTYDIWLRAHRFEPEYAQTPSPEGLVRMADYRLEIQCAFETMARQPWSFAAKQALSVLPRTLRVLLPLPTGVERGARAYLAAPVGTTGGYRFGLLSIGAVVERDSRLYFSNAMTLQPDAGDLTCADVMSTKSGDCLVSDYLRDLRSSTAFTVFSENGVRWTPLLVRGFGSLSTTVAVSGGSPNLVGYEWLANGGILLAVPSDREADVTVREVGTGWTITEFSPFVPGADGHGVETIWAR